MCSYSDPTEDLHFYAAIHILFILRVESEVNVSVICKENMQKQLMEVLFL